jgi:hypothetical protein
MQTRPVLARTRSEAISALSLPASAFKTSAPVSSEEVQGLRLWLVHLNVESWKLSVESFRKFTGLRPLHLEGYSFTSRRLITCSSEL